MRLSREEYHTFDMFYKVVSFNDDIKYPCCIYLLHKREIKRIKGIEKKLSTGCPQKSSVLSLSVLESGLKHKGDYDLILRIF